MRNCPAESRLNGAFGSTFAEEYAPAVVSGRQSFICWDKCEGDLHTSLDACGCEVRHRKTREEIYFFWLHVEPMKALN